MAVRKINWALVLGTGVFALNAAGTLGTIVAFNQQTVTDSALMRQDIASIRQQQVASAAQIEGLYNRFVDAGFASAFRK